VNVPDHINVFPPVSVETPTDVLQTIARMQ